jgi:hypothetical protein
MILKEGQAAIHTAGERLEHLETWMRRTFIPITISAVMTAVLAIVGAYGAYEYIRIKCVVVEARSQMAKGLESFSADMQKKAQEFRDSRGSRAEMEKIARDIRADFEKKVLDFRTDIQKKTLAHRPERMP